MGRTDGRSSSIGADGDGPRRCRKLRMTFFSAPGPDVDGGGGTHASGTSSPTADSDLFDIARSSPTCKRNHRSASQQGAILRRAIYSMLHSAGQRTVEHQTRNTCR